MTQGNAEYKRERRRLAAIAAGRTPGMIGRPTGSTLSPETREKIGNSRRERQAITGGTGTRTKNEVKT